MNKERMLKLADAIENADKSQFHLGSWFGQRSIENDEWSDMVSYRGEVGQYFSQFPNEMQCGTTACIAGWAVAMKFNFDPKAYVETTVEDVAAEYLEINKGQAFRLFFANQNSVWADHQDEYGYRVVEKDIEDDDCIVEYDIEPREWDVTNKDAAHLLRRIAKGEVLL